MIIDERFSIVHKLKGYMGVVMMPYDRGWKWAAKVSPSILHGECTVLTDTKVGMTCRRVYQVNIEGASPIAT